MEYCTLFIIIVSVQLLLLEFISTTVASKPYTERDYTSLTTLLTIISHSPHNNFSVVHFFLYWNMLFKYALLCKFGYFTEKTTGNKVVTVLNNF